MKMTQEQRDEYNRTHDEWGKIPDYNNSYAYGCGAAIGVWAILIVLIGSLCFFGFIYPFITGIY